VTDIRLDRLARFEQLVQGEGQTSPRFQFIWQQTMAAIEDEFGSVASQIDAIDDYFVSFFFTAVPTASQKLCLHAAGVTFTIPADFTGALFSNVGTNPTASFALDVKQNGTTIGTITVSTGGAVTATTTSGTAKQIIAGDLISIIAPAGPDATAADMAFTIKGER